MKIKKILLITLFLILLPFSIKLLGDNTSKNRTIDKGLHQHRTGESIK